MTKSKPSVLLFISLLTIYIMLSQLYVHAQDTVQSITIAEKKSYTLPGKTMNNARLDKLIRRLDNNPEGRLGFWKFTIEGRQVNVITDEKADRMRIISPIAKSEELERDRLYRLMQANFDSALDARYSVAQNILWSTFIHPLSSLEDKEFLSALGQVLNLASTYGSSYSSGALVFRGGDSEELRQRELIDKLMKKGLDI